MTRTWRRLGRGLLALAGVLACGGGVGAAWAHTEDPTLVAVLDAVEPAPPGVTVQVFTTVAEQMVVANPGPTPLEVLDPDGTPFLRVWASGAFGNLADPFFLRTLNPPEVPVPLPRGARAGARPNWTQLSTADSWGWFDPRLHPSAPAKPTDGSVVGQWRVEMRFGAQPVTVTGALMHRAVTGSFFARPEPRSDGIKVDVGQGRMPALLVVAPGRRIVVGGADGVDFLRLDASGAFANPASSSFRDNPDLAGRPPGADGWVRIGEPGELRWLDSRLRWSADRPPAVVERARRETVLSDWRIPMRVDGRSAPLRGTLSWVPNGASPAARGGSDSGWVLPTAAGAVLAAALLLVRVAQRRAKTELRRLPTAAVPPV